MDADNQPIHKRRISKLSGRARKLKQLERDKDNRVATVGPNHPALAVSCMRGPTMKNAMSAPLGVRTSPRRTQDASAINHLALFAQQARAAGMTVPIDPVILNLDEALVNLADKVGICVCPLHPPNTRHLCLSPTCQQCRAERSATFC
jgi:hypothetical protein